MESHRFAPSVDWNHELVASTLWVLKAFGIAALGLLVVLVLLGRLTQWGRQFWTITGKYFVSRASLPVWFMRRRVGPDQCSAELLQQRPLHGASGGVRGQRVA
jgi:hypothetical protein